MSYDYIVVGAGSSGAAVASRLSERADVNVLLVEAGGSGTDMNVKIPAAFSKQFKSKLDWDYTTQPEPHLDGREIYHPRGKMLGGCSAQNAMIYIRGNKADYDEWAKNGATGWSYDEVLPYFRRAERNSRGADHHHGADGPLHIEDPRDPHELSQRIVDGMVAAGIPRNDDFNGSEQLGSGLYQVTQHKGRRWTTSDGYLVPNKKRPNLTIWTGGLVHRVVLENGRAVGVEVERGGKLETVQADREVILSAGAFGSPQLLMLSGIGPADHLRDKGIEVVVDNEHVGAHLMDHPMYMVNFEVEASNTLADAEKPLQLANYFLRRKGLLTSNVGEAGAFFHTREGDAAPYMQLIAAPGYFWNHGFDSHEKPAIAIGCSMVGAVSEGHVRLASSNPSVKPEVTFNYFAEKDDMDAMVTAVEKAREIAASGPLAGMIVKELHPGPEANDRAGLEVAIRQGVEHTYHPSCTARMGAEGEGVVDYELKVHGVEGLRVVDCSVFPRIPHGNTHAPAVMVAEKAADLIGGAR